jgi:cathepsin X
MKYFAAAAVLGYVSAKPRLANPSGPCRLPMSEDFQPLIKTPLIPTN